MPVGDFTSVFSISLANDAALARLPAAGVEELVLNYTSDVFEGAAPNGVPAIHVTILSGTAASLAENGDAGLGATKWGRQTIILTNALTGQLVNKGGVAAHCSLAVVEVG
jgi:hypothetical protein